MPVPFAVASLSSLLFGATAASFLGVVIPAIVWLIIRALGVGAVTYVGLDVIQGQVEQLILGSLSEIQGQYALVYQAFGLMNIDIFINGILSAFAVRLSIKFFCRTTGGKMRQLSLFNNPC